MSKGKFYVVWEGHNPGIYNSWPECQKEIKNVKGALYKSFKDLEEAKNAFSMGYKKFKKSLQIENLYPGPNLNSVSVDAASSGNPGVMEYQGVDTKSKKFSLKWARLKMRQIMLGNF